MPHSTSQTHDIELGPPDIQSLSNADEITAFFARLGYRTDSRIPQTPANLGITAEGTARPIKKIELIADQESLFQVYLFELTSVTIAHTRALARTFRNRAGNYLLVLTSDYERLDFVLLEKYLPAESDNGSTIAPKQVGIRPRVLTVERRKPSRIQLRVLRRFTWTESDPFAQHEKLLSAYAVADWSEEFFNNRALFSDYYLLERLRERPEWSEDPKPAYVHLRQLYEGAASRFAGKEEGILRQELLEPVLQALGFEARPGKKSGSSAAEPDYRLYSSGRTSHRDFLRSQGSPLQQQPQALCLVYPWGRFLDGKDDQRDKETPEENPGAVVVSLLEGGEAPWVLVTNGKLWRLYAQRTHSRATNYYEIDLEEVLAQAGPYTADPAEAFRYFWLLFRCQAFEPMEVEREGKKVTLSLLDQLLLESEDYAKELGERLKERVFEEVFPHLAAGFITHIRERDGLHAALSQEVLNTVFQGTLTLLYRLLFLLYAEARDLLPVKEVRGYFETSLTKLKGEVAKAAENIADEVEERLKKRYRDDRYELYERLVRLFQVVDKGDTALNVPVYNGGLFLSNPEDRDESQEAQAARFLNTTRVPDRFLAHALDLLARDVDSKRHDLVSIDYKSLGVRQLGSIYEGLLEFKLCIADHKLAVVKEKGREVYVPFSDLGEKERERADRQGRVIRKGQAYLENDKRERKATGSYYTPDYIVQYIVEHAVGPVLQEKFAAIRLKLREAQKWHRDMVALAKAKGESTSKYEFGPAVEHKWGSLVDELFNVKVLDPAMGSGHFLAEAVDYITDKALDFLNAFPWNPVVAHLSRMRETILREMDEQAITIDAKRLTDVNLLKRHVLKRCIYGVDLNPMAVELAKVSLWLDCFTLGAPLSFLDHHLRCGNSLIGVTVQEVREAVEPVTKITDKVKVAASATEWRINESLSEQFTLFGSRFAGLLLATDLMRHVGELSDVTSAQVQESRSEYRKASDALAPFKRILNVYTSQWFGNGNADVGARRRRAQSDSPALAFLKSRAAESFINSRDDKVLKRVLGTLSPQDHRMAETALMITAEKRFFHWELEFPEVFYGPRPGTTQAIERLEGAGFDAVIGNPPYDELSEYAAGRELPEKEYFKATPLYTDSLGGRLNIFRPFILRSISLLRHSGFHSFIVPMALLADNFTAALRRRLLTDGLLRSVVAFPQKDDPHNRVFFEAKLSTCIYVVEKQPNPDFRITIKTYPGRSLHDKPKTCTVSLAELKVLEPNGLSLPSIDQYELERWRAVTTAPRVTRFVSVAPCYLGEVMFNSSNQDLISSEPVGPRILRGGNVNRYQFLNEAKQGEIVFLRYKEFVSRYSNDARVGHSRFPRAAFQEAAPIDNWRRLIPAYLPSESICGHTLRYFTTDSRYDLFALLACFASAACEWRFNLTSTNNHVNAYEVDALPIPHFARLMVTEHKPVLIDWKRWGSILSGEDEVGVVNWEKAALAEMRNTLPDTCTWPDSIHDALATAGKEMTRLGEERQRLTKDFAAWLVERLSIDEERFNGITYIRGGQASFDQMGWDVFLELLRRNGRACGVDPDRCIDAIRKRYAEAAAKLTKNRARFATLDAAIDRVVWQLVGLSPDGSIPVSATR